MNETNGLLAGLVACVTGGFWLMLRAILKNAEEDRKVYREQMITNTTNSAEDRKLFREQLAAERKECNSRQESVEKVFTSGIAAISASLNTHQLALEKILGVTKRVE